jgi:hypothetical protein
MRQPAPCLLLAAALVLPEAAGAAIFCVGDGPSLQNALTQAATNGEHDEIRLRSGTYTMSSGTTAFTFNSAEPFRLVISGGWQTLGAIPCAIASRDPNLSVLDGGNQRRVLDLRSTSATPPADIEVRNLTIRRGIGAGFGGIRAESIVAFIVLDRLIVRDNHATTAGSPGGILVPAVRRIDVRNSLILGNTCVGGPCAARLASTTTNLPAITFTFNTIARNRCTVLGCEMPGVAFDGTATCDITNNAFRDAGNHADFFNPNCHLRRNMIGGYGGTPASVMGTIDPDDPGFVDPVNDNFRLRQDSPLVDAGERFVDGEEMDLDGNARPNGRGNDIGAYELQYMVFADGFETEQE